VRALGRKLLGCVAAATCIAAVATVGVAHADNPHVGDTFHQIATRDAHGNPHGGGGGGSSVNLIDHGGPVLSHASLYAIWWGSAGWPSDTQSALGDFLGGFGTSRYLQIAAQYMRGANLSASLAKTYVDPSTPPGSVKTSTIAAEIQKVLNGAAPDPNGVYVVFTSNFPNGGNYCAWHSGATVNGVAIAQAYIPNTTGIAGCDPGNLYGANGFSEGTRSIANVTAHELMESVTDKLPGGTTTAWTDAQGSEIGDKCAWTFAGPVTVGSYSWQLQQEWSNAVSGCVQQ
jgi:hypothetical protein